MTARGLKQLRFPSPQGENGRLEELLRRRKAEVTVLIERRRRLEQQLEHLEREAGTLRIAGDRLQVGSAARVACAVARFGWLW